MNEKSLTVFLVLLSVCSFFSGGANARELPYFESNQLTPYWPSADNQNYKPAKVESFKAINQDKKVLTQNAFKDRVSLVNFFFRELPRHLSNDDEKRSAHAKRA